MTARLIGRGTCPDGHATSVFDLIIRNTVFAAAATMHQGGITFEPRELRDWLEADHSRLHNAGEAIVNALAYHDALN